MSKLKQMDFTRSGKKFIYFIVRLCHRFGEVVCGVFQLSNPVIRWDTYILLNISIANSHAMHQCTNANSSPLHGTIYRAYNLTTLDQ